MVRGIRSRAEPAGGLHLACVEVHARSAGRFAANRLRASPADHLGQGKNGPDTDPLLVPTRALLVRSEKECAVVRPSRCELYHLDFAVTEIHHGRIARRQVRSSDAKTTRTYAPADPEPSAARRIRVRSVFGERHHA